MTSQRPLALPGKARRVAKKAGEERRRYRKSIDTGKNNLSKTVILCRVIPRDLGNLGLS